MRTASLPPAATDLVHLLGLDAALVGISADSDWPPELVQRLPVLNTVAIDTSGLSSSQIDAAASDGHRGGSLYHVDPDRLRAARPDLILSLEQIATEFPGLTERPGWAELPAVWAGRVYAGNTHLFSRSGPRLVDGVEVLARLLHPDVFLEPLPDGSALVLSSDGARLVPFR